MLCMMLSGCAEKKEKLPTATYMGGNNTITEICTELSSAGASHVDTFQEWVTDFADSAGKNAKLKDSWSVPDPEPRNAGKSESDRQSVRAVLNIDPVLAASGVLRRFQSGS